MRALFGHLHLLDTCIWKKLDYDLQIYELVSVHLNLNSLVGLGNYLHNQHTCNFNDNDLSKGHPIFCPTLMICCQRFTSAAKVLLCESNRYKLEKHEQFNHLAPTCLLRNAYYNLVNWVPHHGAKLTLSYKYCNSISTHKATYIPLPSIFKHFLRKYCILHPSPLLTYILYFLWSVDYVIRGPSTIVRYGAKTLLREDPLIT